ncbi:MAG: hypothetical protein O7B98_13210 [Alphaproteobacteria bacterium]|nr:hypothetical protein [Alphaproteobacteria bacterium]
MARAVRRIIAAHNENGESYIQEDSGAPNVTNTGGIEGYLWTELWAVDGTPASNAGNADAADRPISLQPPVRGNVFRIVDIPPDTLRFGANLDQAADTSTVAGEDAYAAGAGSRHPQYFMFYQRVRYYYSRLPILLPILYGWLERIYSQSWELPSLFRQPASIRFC